MGKDEFDEFDEFDFLDQVMPNYKVEQQKETRSLQSRRINMHEDMVYSSYLLVNALINILINKRIISMDEVSLLLEELHEELKRNRGWG